jgi:hypothetical protein
MAMLVRRRDMTLSPKELRVELRRAGIANAAVDAVWPQWWSSEAESSLSATAELTFTVARRLGLSPEDLLSGEAKFVWRDETKYKRLTTKASREDAALSSFGCAVARAAVAGLPGGAVPSHEAIAIREAILRNAAVVGARGLLAFAWGLGIPVLQLRVFPLQRKGMHAMSVGVRDRAAILLARAESYMAPMTFTLAHEIGHVMLGHLYGAEAVVDFGAPLESPDANDEEETAADRFALELLTGQAAPEVVTDVDRFSATQLAAAVAQQGPRLGIEPGILALCAGYNTGQWDKAYGALKIIPPQQQDVSGQINTIANRQLDWSAMTSDNRDYLHVVMGLPQDHV